MQDPNKEERKEQRIFVNLAYIDDSDTKNKRRKWQVMAGVIIHDASFHWAESSMERVRDELVPPEKLDKFEEFHASELYGGYGVFEGIPDDKRMDAITKLLRLLDAHEMSIVYGAVNIAELPFHFYASADPMDIAFRICLEGVDRWITGRTDINVLRLSDGSKESFERLKHGLGNMANAMSRDMVIVIVDECSPKTRDMLHTSYRAFRYSPNFHDDMYFGDSRYSMGIQLADLCAYFIGRHLEGDTETKPFYDMVSPHITFSLQQPKQPGDGAEVVKDAK